MIAFFEEGPPPTSPAQKLLDQFEDAYRSALPKESASDLTQEETCALLLFAGVPYRLNPTTAQIEFVKCGLYKKAGTWTAVIAP